MNNLILVKNNISYFDSRQVAEMIGKRHADLMRSIDGYVEVLGQNAKLRSDTFFKKSSYKAGTGKVYPCYLISKMGCEFIANKMTGDKGILFTAIYVKQFNEMEQIQMQKKTKQWQELRDLSKVKARFLNNTIKEFIEYAEAQGSKHAQKYYTIFNKLINSITATYDRDNTDIEHLNNILFIINMAEKCIHEGIAKHRPYKEIYTTCRDRLKTMQLWSTLSIAS